ncbi:hypothetical protein LNV23_04055 [Paucibacter sp. DJ1R-11]|uniref:COG3904 family protein n=1 Tax=Paucibacter sp. DJ1R-11 TaxID=2893556 RepID=UPI0021E494DC|nr:hypothetical protein [Paucibacter sp. DJ1R-11]MCV2362622.1 hypothetical protein [Paucibacter sp. DJ1R-11]
MSLKNHDPTQADHSDESASQTPAPGGDPTGWQQAAKARPRSASPKRAAHPVPTERRPGYLASHWHGEQSLAQSFWLNNVLLSVPLAMLLTGVMSWISVKGGSLQISAIATLLGWPLLIAFNVWCIVGAWRAASEYLRMGGTALWTWLARLSLGLGALQMAASLLFGLLPDLGEYWQMARGIDPIGQATLKVSADGHVVQLRGPIGMGDAGRLQRLLEATPTVRRLELASPGGRVYEAEQVLALMSKSRYNTRAVGNCESACTLLFLAGRERQLMPGAQLGFHRASTGTYNPVFDELANQELAALYRRIGLPEDFIRRTVKTPSSSMWYPHSDELVAHALIAALPQTLDVALPAGQDNQAADFADALQGSPAWHALDQRFAGTLERLAARMQAARAAAASDEALQSLGYAELAPRMPELIASVNPIQRRQYAQLLRAQLKTALGQPGTGSEACLALLSGQVALRRQLPLELQIRETAWLVEAARSEPPRFAPKPATAIELEVMRRTLGSHSPGLLAGLWEQTAAPPSGRAAANRCETVIQTLDRAAALPVAQRELAERVLFQRL